MDAFQADHRGRDALAAVAKAFKRAASVLDHCAPPPGQHEFTLGDRVILCNLQNRADLNNCAAVVKCKSDPVDGDGRVEVSVGSGSRREMLRIKPSNLRLEWHLAAETHVSQTGSRVQVRQLDSSLHGQICQVISSDPSTRTVSVQQEKMYLQKMSPGTTVAIADVAASGLVPAVYIIIAKEVQNQAETVAVRGSTLPSLYFCNIWTGTRSRCPGHTRHISCDERGSQLRRVLHSMRAGRGGVQGMRACDGRTPQRGPSKHNAIVAAAGPLRETGLDQLFFEGLFAPRRPQIAEGLLVRCLSFPQ